MAKRSTRQRLVDKIESAARRLEQAESLMAEAVNTYHEHGKFEGAQLDMIRGAVVDVTTAVKRFRIERM